MLCFFGEIDGDIEQTYRRLARRWHPDRRSEREADVRFKRISEAYRTLFDPIRSAIYRRFGAEAVGSESNLNVIALCQTVRAAHEEAERLSDELRPLLEAATRLLRVTCQQVRRLLATPEPESESQLEQILCAYSEVSAWIPLAVTHSDAFSEWTALMVKASGLYVTRKNKKSLRGYRK